MSGKPAAPSSEDLSIPLITLDDTGRFSVNPEAIDFVSGPLGFELCLTAAYPCRSGRLSCFILYLLRLLPCLSWILVHLDVCYHNFLASVAWLALLPLDCSMFAHDALPDTMPSVPTYLSPYMLISCE